VRELVCAFCVLAWANCAKPAVGASADYANWPENLTIPCIMPLLECQIRNANLEPQQRFVSVKNTDDCPYSCDPVKAFGGPKLSRPDIFFGSLVLFLAAMYFSDKGLERRPFGVQHVCCSLLAVIGGVIFGLAGLPYVLRIIWPLI
jgi:hypothetical protein